MTGHPGAVSDRGWRTPLFSPRPKRSLVRARPPPLPGHPLLCSQISCVLCSSKSNHPWLCFRVPLHRPNPSPQMEMYRFSARSPHPPEPSSLTPLLRPTRRLVSATARPGHPRTRHSAQQLVLIANYLHTQRTALLHHSLLLTMSYRPIVDMVTFLPRSLASKSARSRIDVVSRARCCEHQRKPGRERSQLGRVRRGTKKGRRRRTIFRLTASAGVTPMWGRPRSLC